jgi:plasmid maintenance system antidote protein VapI
MIRDRIVFGTSSSKIRKKLINKGYDLTLENAIQIAQSYEYSQQQLSSMAASSEVNAVRQTTKKESYRQKQQISHRDAKKKTLQGHTCQRCEHSKHAYGVRCPAQNETCFKCGRINHFASVCRSTEKSIHNVNDNCGHNSSSDEEFYVDTVSASSSLDRANAQIYVGPSQHPVKFKIDTGSSANSTSLILITRWKLQAVV